MASELVTPLASLAEVTHWLADFLQSDPSGGVIVNTAANSAPDVILRLWARLRDHIWIYDVFDEFCYDARGAKRLQWWLTDRAYLSIASGCCLVSPELEERYASACFLDKASHLSPPKYRRPFDGRVVVTASFDRRTDFALLDAIAQAEPEITIDLYGAVYDNAPSIVAAIDRLLAARRNVRYRGEFAMDRIGDILDGYAVGLVPYRTAFGMTRFINPDKLFHYLCAGLEVIATPIPAVHRFTSCLYETADAPAVVSALHRIRSGERRNPGNLHELFNWHVRSQQLKLFVERLAAGSAR